MDNKVIFETDPPFVIKVYDTFFSINWEAIPVKDEDNYFYKKIKSVVVKEGKESAKRNIFHFILSLATEKYVYGASTKDDDQLLVEFKNGEIESRYFNRSTTNQHMRAVELIQMKLKTNA